MDNPFLQETEPVVEPKSKGHFWVRSIGYVLFISSVAAYGYASQLAWTKLIGASPYDNLLYIYVWSLAVCWVGSVLLMWKWFRYYQNYQPGFRSLILSILPLLILPMAYSMLQVIKIIEVHY